MHKYITVFFLLFALVPDSAKDRDSTFSYILPDSVKAVQFMAEIQVNGMNNAKRFKAGISTDLGQLYLSEYKGKRWVQLQMHEHSRAITPGDGVKETGSGSFSLEYDWKEGQTYRLMVAMAADSADQICLYSAYIFLPEQQKWKLIGTRRHPFWRDRLLKPVVFLRAHKKSTGKLVTAQAWCQRSNGSWKNLKEVNLAVPVINYFGHVDSTTRRQMDTKTIEDSIAAGKTGPLQNKDGVYYTILKEGTGRQVSVNDTVVAFYKGYLFSDGTIFDQTKDKPATFPLNRLIRGWQIGVPLCKVGGKIKLVIPSDLAYTIRTRAAKIPPNSILVFEVEVVDARQPH